MKHHLTIKSSLDEIISDAKFIFDTDNSSTSKDVRDVVEWFSAVFCVNKLVNPITAEDLWINDDAMALNAELGLTMYQLMKLAKVIEKHHGID